MNGLALNSVIQMPLGEEEGRGRKGRKTKNIKEDKNKEGSYERNKELRGPLECLPGEKLTFS
jgi:hypothetical protein